MPGIGADDDALQGKPFTDPYRKGREKHEVPPASCVVVENAPLGQETAKSAGPCRFIGVPTTLPGTCQNGPGYTLPSFADTDDRQARIGERK